MNIWRKVLKHILKQSLSLSQLQIISQYLEDNTDIKVSAKGPESVAPDTPDQVTEHRLQPEDVEVRHGGTGHDGSPAGPQTSVDDHRVRGAPEGGQGADVVHGEKTTSGKR